MTETERTDRIDCFICGGGNREVLERHHLVPSRFDGDDTSENTVDLCPTCHRALERLYNKRFYDAVRDYVREELNQMSPKEHYTRGVMDAIDAFREHHLPDTRDWRRLRRYKTEFGEKLVGLLPDEYYLCKGCEHAFKGGYCKTCGWIPDDSDYSGCGECFGSPTKGKRCGHCGAPSTTPRRLEAGDDGR